MVWASVVILLGLCHLWRTRQSIHARRELEQNLQSLRASKDSRAVCQQEEVLQALDGLPADRAGSYTLGFVVTVAGVLLFLWRVIASH